MALTLTLQSPGSDINALKAVISFSQHLSFVSADFANSAFPDAIEMKEEGNTLTITRAVFGKGFRGANGSIGTLTFKATTEGNASVTINPTTSETIDTDSLENVLNSVEDASITVAKARELCMKVALDNRVRKAQDSTLSKAHVSIVDEGTKAPLRDLTLLVAADGTVKTKENLGGINAASYSLTLRPRGYLARTLTNITDPFSSTCHDFGTALAGDLDEDGKITLMDLIIAVRHYLRDDNAILKEVFPAGFTLSDLVSLIRNFVSAR